MIRVLVADDHPVYRDGITMALEAADGVAVVGEASDGDEAVTKALELRPDVVLMDLRMPGVSGLDAIRLLTEQAPEIGLLVLTMFDDDQSVRAALRAGARGYLVKGATREVIVRSVCGVADGELVFAGAAAQEVQRVLASGRAGTAVSPFPQLSEREVEVLDLVARGAPNADIARRLVLSEKTVRNHVSNVFGKLGVNDRAQAVAVARDGGLGTGAS